MTDIPRFGISTSSADGYVTPDVLARAVEERGFDWLIFDDHSYFPADTAGRDEIAPAFRARLPLIRDLPVVLAYALSATSRLVVGSGVALLPQRDVLHTAKATATLATLSGDRLVLGVGVGWNLEELRNHGVDPKTRGARLDEQLTALRDIWTREQTEFHGEYVDFGPIVSRPRPGLPVPIYVGGASKAALSRAVRLADGWLPLAPGTTPDDVQNIRSWFAGQGRADLAVTVTEVPADEAMAAKYFEAGVDRVLFHLDPLSEADTLRALDSLVSIRPS
ncbi:LLM class F420-dependent oxidoreductase [Mycobacterium sp. CBMA 623]|nr:LLM class F420-dependent oxidoreductase [Mycobacteroides sp. CBMA 326]